MNSLSAKSIGHHIRLPRMILQGKLIIFQEFHPSSLPHVQILLIEQILQTFTITENCERTSIQIVPPNLESIHYRSQLQVMSGIVLLVSLQLSRSISYCSSLLHHHTTQTIV